MPPIDPPRTPPQGPIFGARGPASASPAPMRAPDPRDDESTTELDAELARAEASVRSASVGLWLVVIVAAVLALGVVAASLFMQR
jgi:hypothetical protein